MLENRPEIKMKTDELTTRLCNLASSNQTSWGAYVTDMAVLPQNRVETPIGSQAEFEITN